LDRATQAIQVGDPTCVLCRAGGRRQDRWNRSRFRYFTGNRRSLCIALRYVRELHQRNHIVRSAGFDTGTDAASAHAAERLAEDDRAGCRAVDVEIAGPDAIAPEFLLAIVEALEAGGEAVAGCVDEVDCVVEVAS